MVILGPTPKLPVIDFSDEKLMSSWTPTCNAIRQALEEYGVFVAVYTGILPELEDAAFGSMKEIYPLPFETKAQNVSDRPLHGYLGYKPPLPSIHESFGIEHAQTLEGTEKFTKLMWPSGNDSFSKNILAFAQALWEFDKMAKRMILESYGAATHADEFVASTNYLLRLIKYRVPEEGECNIGAHCHTDKGLMTIIHQNEINGLEIKRRDGVWVKHEYIPSSYVVFAGDALSGWSNGRIHSPPHQVVMNGDVTRYCMGLFSFCNGTVRVPDELVDDDHPLQFKPFSNYGLLNFFMSDHDLNRKTAPCIQDYCGVEGATV